MTDIPNQILRHKTASILLIEERKRKDIVIGAPHHSPGGVKELPCKDHKASDENSGFIAREIALKLKLASVIACNYTIDSNKNLSSDYSLQIAKWSPKYLIEIHGHGAGKADKHKIEISSGNLERNKISIKFATTLNGKCSKNKLLKKFTACGDFNKIYFTAINSVTITDARWIPIHIELPPLLRIDRKNKYKLPKESKSLVQFLIASITEVCI